MREKKEINILIGNQIKIARESAGLTQERFSELVSLAPNNVSDIERGVVGVSLSSLLRICEVLSVSSDSILFPDKNIQNNSNDIKLLTKRLGTLSSDQLDIVMTVVNKLFEAFAL